MRFGRISKKLILFSLPYIYFSSFLILATVPDKPMIGLLLALPFILQLMVNLKFADILLGSVTLFFSFWMMLAYASDFHKISNYDYKAWSFIGIGGLIVCLNFVMTFFLYRNASIRLDNPAVGVEDFS